MARKLYISGALGTMMISDGSVPDIQASSSPLAYRQKLYFHSGLPYIQIKQKIYAGSLTFPPRARGIEEWADGSKGCGGGC